jgi:hypothetical protein
VAQGAGAVEGVALSVCLYQAAIFTLVCTAQSGTSPTLDVDIEGYDLASATWFTLFSFTQSTTATTSETKCLGDGAGTMLLPDQIRAKSTVGGTGTPTKTFSIGLILRR